jgi:CRISPR-associated protein Csb2
MEHDMAGYFCISVTLLQSTFHGRLGKGDSARAEWPPSPLRLFQAMVAGAAARWGADGGRARLTAEAPAAAFRWLGRLTETVPPIILAPRHRPGSTYMLSVPNNAMDVVAAAWTRGNYSNVGDANPATHRTMKPVRPTHLLDGSTVHYLWAFPEPHTDETANHIAALTAAARGIVALGWGIDCAIGNARMLSTADAGALPGERWQPIGATPSSGGALRVPTNDTFDALTARHEAFLNRLAGGFRRDVPPLPERAFNLVTYTRPTDPRPRPFAAFALRPVDPESRATWRAFRQERAVWVAAMLRHAACEAARSDLDPSGWRTEEWGRRFVAGHGPDPNVKRRPVGDVYPRFSYIPLPSIGHPHADGMIRRVVIAEPFGGNDRAAEWARRRLSGAALVDEAMGDAVASLELVESSDREFRTVFSSYVGNTASRDWVSVTPVVLPGFDDGKFGKAERLLMKAVQQSGLPVAAIKDVALRKAPFWPGSQHPRLYHRPAHLRDLPGWHVHLRLCEPITGPVAVGSGRHCGLGVFAAAEHDL